MKKVFCSLVLCAFLMAGCVQKQPVSGTSEMTFSSRLSEAVINSSASDVILENDEYEYKIVDKSVILVRYKGNATDVVMPDMIDGYPVKEIESAFFKTNVKTVILPENVENFNVIFTETNITEVFIPDSVISIIEGAFDDCPRELVLLYDNNPLVPKYAEENNIVCVKRSEYSPILTVELVNGKPLNDEKKQGISQEDYNLIKRRNNAVTNWFEIYVSNEYIDFKDKDYEELNNKTIKAKLTKTATLLYQCGITNFDPADIPNANSDYLDKMATFAIYSRSKEEIEEEDEKGSSGILFADDEKIGVNFEIFFGIKPDFSKVTGYSQQQKGIWYYPMEFPNVQTEVLSFSSNAEKMEYTLELRFTPESGNPIEKTFSFKLTEEGTVGGDHHRITLTGIN